MRVFISVLIEDGLEDISVSDLWTATCKDGSTLRNCGMMTGASVMCGHIPSFWKFPYRCYQVHFYDLVLRPSNHRIISIGTDRRRDRKVQLRINIFFPISN